MRILGDRHNNSAVYRHGLKVFKPGNRLLESFFLGSISPLNYCLNRILDRNYLNAINSYFIRNNFHFDSRNNITHSNFYHLPSVSSSRIQKNSLNCLAYILAIAQLFGIEDLHCENIRITTNKKANKFFILDIETAFSKIDFIKQTHLIKSNKINRKSGLQALEGQIEIQNLLTLLDSYIDIVSTIKKSEKELMASSVKALKGATVRYIHRDTKEYCSKHPFLPCEEEQLKEGNIPYYFRYFGENEIYYLNKSKIKKATFNVDSSIFLDTRGGNLNSTQYLHGNVFHLLNYFLKGEAQGERNNIKIYNKNKFKINDTLYNFN